MKLHVFNPEHDLALANNDVNFVAPHVARQMRSDLSFIPVFWADDGDCILVDDVENAEKSVRVLHRKLPNIHFINAQEISHFSFSEISVWGWDLPLRRFLQSSGVDDCLLPSDNQMHDVRRLSNRRFAMLVLKEMCSRLTSLYGEGRACKSVDEINNLIDEWHHVVIKAPWSSSGRGIRFADKHIENPMKGWCENILKKQTELCVEPYYNKVKDFGMEFESDGKGNINYCGLSLFKTENAAYTGNIVATESTKIEMLSHYISNGMLSRIKEELQIIFSDAFNGHYRGAFGVDMMVVAGMKGKGFVVNPCVEVNLRRTMGHVALSLSPDDDEIKYLMRIMNVNSNYNIKLTKL